MPQNSRQSQPDRIRRARPRCLMLRSSSLVLKFHLCEEVGILHGPSAMNSPRHAKFGNRIRQMPGFSHQGLSGAAVATALALNSSWPGGGGRKPRVALVLAREAASLCPSGDEAGGLELDWPGVGGRLAAGVDDLDLGVAFEAGVDALDALSEEAPSTEETVSLDLALGASRLSWVEARL